VAELRTRDVSNFDPDPINLLSFAFKDPQREKARLLRVETRAERNTKEYLI
jgi:hypothetical protein